MSNVYLFVLFEPQNKRQYSNKLYQLLINRSVALILLLDKCVYGFFFNWQNSGVLNYLDFQYYVLSVPDDGYSRNVISTF